MSDQSETTRNQVGLRLGEMLPGSTDNGERGVPVTGKPASQTTGQWSEHGEILEADMLASRIRHFLSDARLIPTAIRVLLRDAETALKGYASGQ